MKAICFSKLLWLTVFAGLILAVPGSVYSQAPPGPVPAGQPQPVPASEAKPQEQIPAPPPRTTILGAWKFNPDESDDPSKRRQDSRGSNGGGSGGGRGRMGGGGRGGGYGGRGGGGESDEEREEKSASHTPGPVRNPTLKRAGRSLVVESKMTNSFISA